MFKVTYDQQQQDHKPAPENLEARQWLKETKFDLFVHWGLYSCLGDGEWMKIIKASRIKYSTIKISTEHIWTTNFD
ncbi:alpha-L-fucosidase [Maribacter sp. ACAM166]|uniref:alpha-L-fucosidase n=1 Tax=Maribacter sp. ACAM166 TaxID=2508996 RepID=UPI0010FDF914|nr:hypothetical protein ES765_20195 [Maribacter sp. ACAM166]